MKLVVPGASGFIGKNLILKCPRDWEVLAIYNRSDDFPDFVEQAGLAGVRTARCDLTDLTATARLAAENGPFDACVFLAANGDPTSSMADPKRDLRSTVFTFLDFNKVFDVHKLIYISSGAVYDGLQREVSPSDTAQPELPYAISHLACENYLKVFAGLGRPAEYLILRFFGAFGPYEPPRKIYSRLVNAFQIEKRHDFMIRGDGTNLIDAMFVDDAVEGILRAVTSSAKNVTVDFCSGQRLTIEELVNRAAKTFRLDDVEITREGETAEPINFWASPDEMANLFAFTPQISLEDGLTRLAAFLEERK